MTCPYFVDYTRNCLTEFPQMFQYSDFDLCDSDDYDNCLHYYFAKTKSRCKYVSKCANYFIDNTPEIFKNMFNSVKKGDLSDLHSVIFDKKNEFNKQYNLLGERLKKKMTLY